MGKIMERARPEKEFVPQPDDDLVICRCEEITKGEIRRAVYDGMNTINEVKRFLRAGMGLCQGQTCARLVRGIIAKELEERANALEMATPRSPARPIAMQIYARDGFQKEKR